MTIGVNSKIMACFYTALQKVFSLNKITWFLFEKNRKDENFEELDALMKAMEDIVSNCEMYNTESQKSSEKVQNFVETSSDDSESDVDLENVEISDENSQGFNPVYQIQKSTSLSQGAVNSKKDLVEKETRKPSKIPILKRAN